MIGAAKRRRRTPYTEEFYRAIGKDARRSAEQVLPFVLDLVRPASIVDVGCGSGEWVKVAMDSGLTEVVGIDGSYARGHLVFPPEAFVAADLTRELLLPRRFDMAMSIEVAEHLAAEHAERFVRDLTRLAPIVLFGAAVPGQGGVDHLNEQWLDYWAGHFAGHDFVMVDCVRRQFWDNPDVVFHSAQNLALMVHEDRLAGDQRLMTAHDPLPLRVVHPTLFQMCQPQPPYLGRLVRQLPEATRRTVRARIRR